MKVQIINRNSIVEIDRINRIVEIALSQRIKAYPVPYSVWWLMQVTCEIHPKKIKTDNSKPAFFWAIQPLKTLINFFGTSLLFITLAYSSLCLTTIHWAANKYNSTQEAANKSPFNTCSHYLLHMSGLPRGYWFTTKVSFSKHIAEQYLNLKVKKVGFLNTWGSRVENRQNHSADTTRFL